MSIQLDKEGTIARITLNRPDKYNAITEDMKNQLFEVCSALNSDKSVRAVLLTGAGQNFCSGSDVSGMRAFNLADGRARCQHAHRTLLSLYYLEKPVVCAVRGWVSGSGLSMMLCSDIIIASETSQFSAIFKKIGLAPDNGAVFFLTQYLGINRAKEMVMSARGIPADEAKEIGLVTEVVTDDQLMERANYLANELADGPTYALAMGKKMFQAMSQPTLEQFLETETQIQAPILQSEDYKEAITAFMEKRPAKFQGG